jgi:hypothetical protein
MMYFVFCLLALSTDETPPCEPCVPEATKTPQRSLSPIGSNMVMSSIQLKNEEEDEKCRKRRRSSSGERPGIGQLPSPTLPPPKVMKIKEKFFFLLEPWVFLIHILLLLLMHVLCGVFIESAPLPLSIYQVLNEG